LTIGEQFRNLVERNRFNRMVEGLSDAIGAVPAYRRLVMRRVHRRIEHVRRQRSYGLMIELSSVCNARCVFCPHPTMQREKRIMDDDLFEQIVSRIIEEKIRPTRIDLFNVGEPLTDRSLFQRIRRLKEAFPSALVAMTTNFALATPAIIEELLASGLDRIQISLNAASRDSHREIMGLDYDKTVRNIEMLIERRRARKSPLYVMLSFVLCEQNRSQARDFMRTWEDKVDCVWFQRAIDWGGAVDISSPYTGSPYPCNDLFERIVILSNGEFALCCQDYSGLIRSNVRDTPILAAFHSKPFEEIREVHLKGDIRSLQMCRDCFGVYSNGTNWLLRSAPALTEF
jgi:pyruvate-formate lyase-activating enzyme